MKKSLLFIVLLVFNNIFAQKADSVERLKLFLNCNADCFQQYVFTELSFFNFVRDRFQADIQILIISQENGAGGSSYTLTFIGQNQFKNQNDTLKFSTKQADTEDMMRNQLVRTLKLGLVQYLKHTEWANQISVDIPKRATEKALIQKDKWDYWVFTLGGWGNLNAESNILRYSVGSYLVINRIKPELKIESSFDYSYNFSKFIFETTDDEGNVISETIKAKNDLHSTQILAVKSLSEHWAMGGYMQNNSSVASNIRFGTTIAPAIEYNIFPNSVNTQKQFRLIAQTGYRMWQLRAMNERDRLLEFEPYYRFDAIISLVQPWGSVGGQIGGHHFFREKDTYRISGRININWRAFEGFNFNISVGASYVQDQIFFLPKDINRNNVLLGAGILGTNFTIWGWGEISYTFGSINNSVVNPRFRGIYF
ncbi:MAG: hypothetical protein NZ516_06880 [Raineya sp.]|nr:hypothetical protein [Raineya sp.]